MDSDFWHQRWEKGDIGFHEHQVNPFLIKYIEQLSAASGARIFLPLCGKTRDISWLLSQGYRVAGAELSELAVSQLFRDLGIEPEVSEDKGLVRYHANAIDIIVGDIFNVSADMLGPVDAVYDRAALVAMPAKTRHRYADHLMAITGKAPQLLITYEYDQVLMEGPPFSVGSQQVQHYYAGSYDVKLVEHKGVPGGVKGKIESIEAAWLLQRK